MVCDFASGSLYRAVVGQEALEPPEPLVDQVLGPPPFDENQGAGQELRCLSFEAFDMLGTQQPWQVVDRARTTRQAVNLQSLKWLARLVAQPQVACPEPISFQLGLVFGYQVVGALVLTQRGQIDKVVRELAAHLISDDLVHVAAPAGLECFLGLHHGGHLHMGIVVRALGIQDFHEQVLARECVGWSTESGAALLLSWLWRWLGRCC